MSQSHTYNQLHLQNMELLCPLRSTAESKVLNMNKAELNHSTNANYLAEEEEEAEDFLLKWQARVLTHHPVDVLSM